MPHKVPQPRAILGLPLRFPVEREGQVGPVREGNTLKHVPLRPNSYKYKGSTR